MEGFDGKKLSEQFDATQSLAEGSKLIAAMFKSFRSQGLNIQEAAALTMAMLFNAPKPETTIKE